LWEVITLAVSQPLATSPEQQQLQQDIADYGGDCSEAGLARLRQAVTAHEADVIIGMGGKARCCQTTC